MSGFSAQQISVSSVRLHALAICLAKSIQTLLWLSSSMRAMTLVEQIRLLRNSHADARIVIVADRYRAAELVSVFRAGASGYFVEGITSDEFIKSLELVIIGAAVLPTTFLPDVLSRDEHRLDNHEPIGATDQPTPQLSPREKLILHCLVEGDSNKAIAEKFDSADATVKVHVKAILRKLRVHNRTQAAIWGIKNASQSRSRH